MFATKNSGKGKQPENLKDEISCKSGAWRFFKLRQKGMGIPERGGQSESESKKGKVKWAGHL